MSEGFGNRYFEMRGIRVGGHQTLPGISRDDDQDRCGRKLEEFMFFRPIKGKRNLHDPGLLREKKIIIIIIDYKSFNHISSLES